MKIDKIDVIGNIEVAFVEPPFDKAKKELESNGYKIITLEQNAKLRMQTYMYARISHTNWTAEDFIYLPNNQVYITKNSPIMKNAEKAADCNRKGREFYLNLKQADYALANAVKVKDTEIPTNRFGEDELTNFCFGKSAKAYGEFLNKVGIEEMHINLDNCKEKPFPYARKLLFAELDRGSGLIGNSYCRPNYTNNRRTCGVCKASSEGEIPIYTLNDISRALKKANLYGIEKVLLKKLNE